jgi:hypothetical protein
MATLETILPEIRKGRKFRWNDGQSKPKPFAGFLENWPWSTITGECWELEPDREVIEMRPSIRGREVPDGILIESEVDDDFWATLVHIDHTELDRLHAASLRIRGKEIPQDTQQFTGVDPDYVHVKATHMSAEEAWEKYAKEEQYVGNNGVPNSVSETRQLLIHFFQLGQQSTLPVVEYVEPNPEEIKEAFDKLEAVYKSGWDNCMAAMKGEL